LEYLLVRELKGNRIFENSSIAAAALSAAEKLQPSWVKELFTSTLSIATAPLHNSGENNDDDEDDGEYRHQSLLPREFWSTIIEKMTDCIENSPTTDWIAPMSKIVAMIPIEEKVLMDINFLNSFLMPRGAAGGTDAGSGGVVVCGRSATADAPHCSMLDRKTR
jgi:hypothetical protein